MVRRISLSRAARLVGVKRNVLQQKIRTGELKAFEGEIVLADLLQTYPNAQIEDSGMLERVEQIIEQASFIGADNSQRKPDNVALTTRIMSLSEDLSRQKRLVGKYKQYIETLHTEIARLDGQTDSIKQLHNWVETTNASISTDDDTIDQPFISEAFLRVMSAQATVTPSNHEFFIESVDSILEAGLRGGLALNYGWRSGNCGLSKIRLVSGEIRKVKYVCAGETLQLEARQFADRQVIPDQQVPYEAI